ncbi:thermonuclease family protein [Candidatus Bipolaricaulota bacterium]|nr:thermonuclease family protein [Candidatus Bipolaricaulota bacterium]
MQRSRAVTVFIILLVCAMTAFSQVPDVAFATREGHVLRILDGDTIELRDGETVRLLGIDTPEMGMPYAMDAKLFTIELLSRRDVRLEIDTQERDVYGRLLAHVYVEQEGGWIHVNTELVRAGLAKLLFIPPNARYYGYFQDALNDALLHRRGMFEAISGDGVMSVEELECSLVECVTEVVTVRFVVSETSTERKNIRLGTSEGEYGFHVLIPLDSEAAQYLPPVEELVGQIVEVTGVLECSFRDGPSITVDSPDQITCAIEAVSD